MNFLTDDFLVDSQLFDRPVLVTGAGGCLGAWTLAILARSGVSCVGFDLSDDRRRPALVMGQEEADALVFETGDIADLDLIHGIIKKHNIGAIIHYAGLQIPFCRANPAAGARVNVEGTINVFEAVRQAGIKRLAYASSVAALGIPPGGPYLATLYGAYKAANEHTASVYWQDWQVPTIGIRPNVVYGVGRDQGVSSKSTVAIHSAVLGQAYDIAFSGRVSWLYAGEAAAAFIAAVSRDGDGAHVFDLNGSCEPVDNGVAVLRELEPDVEVTISGEPFPFPPDLDDGPIRAHVGDYPSVSLEDGIRITHRAFGELMSSGLLRDPQ
ncbi:MAG: NAD(P)-dependent oxidoreductase [Rhizobiaceae bacterium]